MSALIHQKRLWSMLRLWSWFQKLFPTYCFVLLHYQECRDNDRLPQCTPIKMLALIMMLFDKGAYMHSCCGSISVSLVISAFWKVNASWCRWKGTLFPYFYDKKILNFCFVSHSQRFLFKEMCGPSSTISHKVRQCYFVERSAFKILSENGFKN